MGQKQTVKTNFLKPQRVFSESIKRQIVGDIERCKCTVIQASRELNVSSTSVYKWIRKYSRHLIKSRVMVVEDQSESYRSKELEKRIKDLEAALGRKQLEIDFLNKVIELANEEYQVDIKKNLPKTPLSGSGSKKDKRTDTK
jgi:transposase